MTEEINIKELTERKLMAILGNKLLSKETKEKYLDEYFKEKTEYIKRQINKLKGQ